MQFRSDLYPPAPRGIRRSRSYDEMPGLVPNDDYTHETPPHAQHIQTRFRFSSGQSPFHPRATPPSIFHQHDSPHHPNSATFPRDSLPPTHRPTPPSFRAPFPRLFNPNPLRDTSRDAHANSDGVHLPRSSEVEQLFISSLANSWAAMNNLRVSHQQTQPSVFPSFHPTFASVPPPQPTHDRPPMLKHIVFRLKCVSCELLLTDRGMKAVLLLRPTISLYSTDALPVNCSALPDMENQAVDPNGRTCDCLTQTLYCHGCGNGVGYAIITPCPNCSHSVNTQNSASGHRFVFHHHAISARERRYIDDERGINPLHYPPPSPVLHSEQNRTSSMIYNQDPDSLFLPPRTSVYGYDLGPDRAGRDHGELNAWAWGRGYERELNGNSEREQEDQSDWDDIDTNPEDGYDEGYEVGEDEGEEDEYKPDSPEVEPIRYTSFFSLSPYSTQMSPSSNLHPHDTPTNLPPVSRVSHRAKNTNGKYRLRRGDVVYWHNLTRSGPLEGVGASFDWDGKTAVAMVVKNKAHCLR